MKASSKSELSGKILIVDDEKVIRDILIDFLGAEGYDIASAGDGEEALDILERRSFDVVLTDLKMPGMSGIDLLLEMKTRGIRVCTIIMTGFGTVESAVESIKRGAFDYIQKPFKMRDVEAVVERGLKQFRLEQENIQLKEIMNLYNISEAMNSTLSLKEILSNILDIVIKEIEADAVAIYEFTEDKGWKLMAGSKSENLEYKKDSEIFGGIDTEAILAYLHDESYLLASGDDIDNYFSKRPSIPQFSSFLAVPLRMKSRINGLVCVYSFYKHKIFLKGHSFVLSILSGRAGSAIENARLYEQLKQVFQETIQALVTALEAKDPYTSGHTKRVTDYASIIAKGMGLPPEDTERITRAALLHDIGKLAIQLDYINKPDELTPEEHEIFKQHTVQGRSILQAVHFLRDIIPIVESHHERLDGSGYPLGLKDTEILLGARIVAVADSFDAMTSDRPYRRSLTRKKAIEELKKYSGTQFDPDIVEIFIRELKKSG